MKPKTVLHVIDTGGPGGAETVFVNTSTGMDPELFRSVCVVGRDGWLAETLRSRGYDPHVVPAQGSVNVAYLWQLLRIARSVNADIIVGHLYGSAIYGSLAGKVLGIPVVSVLHGHSDISSEGRLATLKKRVIRYGTTRTVFVSGELKEALCEQLAVPRDRCVVIHNGIDHLRFARGMREGLRMELGLEPHHILVGAVGNIRAPKAYDVFLRMAHLLKQRSANYRFVIAGEGSGALHDKLLALRKQLSLQNELNFLGLRKDIPDILKAFDIYVSCSHTEGFSISCIEAMAAGVPVVATRSGGPEEIIENERSGLLVPVGSPDTLADAVHRLACDPALAYQLREQALQRVIGHYTLNSMLRSYQRLFLTLLT